MALRIQIGCQKIFGAIQNTVHLAFHPHFFIRDSQSRTNITLGLMESEIIWCSALGYY
jgi:hypothetical protein